MLRTILKRRIGDISEYWEIELQGNSHAICFGKTRTDSVTIHQRFDTTSACVASLQRNIFSQLRKGFENTDLHPSALWRALNDGDETFDSLGFIASGNESNESCSGVSLLELAIRMRKDEIALALWDAGAFVSLLPLQSLNLVWAVGTGRVDLVCSFVDAGADLGIQTGLGTPLIRAIREGASEMVTVLLEAGSDPNTGTIFPPLYEALNKGHEEIALRLIDAGAHEDPNSGYRRYYLDYAIIRSFSRVVERLAIAGYDLESRNSYERGRVPTQLVQLSASCRKCSEEEAYARIVETRDLIRNTMESVTPLLVAVYQDESDCVDILLRYGANVGGIDSSGVTAMELATRMQRGGIYRKLREVPDGAWVRKTQSNDDVSRGLGSKEESNVGERIARLLSKPVRVNNSVVPFVQPLMSVEEFRKNYEYNSVIERLCESCGDESFQAAVKIVAEICKSKRRDRTGEFGGYDFQLSSGTLSLQDLQILQKRLIPVGAFAYCFRKGSDWRIPGGIRVIPTKDRYDCLVVQGTSAGNYEMDTLDIIGWLQARECINPLSILWAEHDKIEGFFLDPIKDPLELAESMYSFCEDIVDQGIGSVGALAQDLQETGRMYFWWD